MNGTMKQNKMNGYMCLESEHACRHAKEFSDDMGQEKNAKDVLAENCKLSGFSMVSVGGSLLMCAGIILYALLGA